MKFLKWIFLIVFLILFGLGIIYFVRRKNKKVDLSEDNYTPDEKLRLEVAGRSWTFSQGTKQNILGNLSIGNENIVSYFGGTFPLTQITEKRKGTKKKPTKFEASEREANRKLLANLVQKYGEFVKAASDRFYVPELYIFIVMALENSEGQEDSGLYGNYVGLTQISSEDFADTLSTQKKRKLLSVSDIKFFSDKLGKSALVTNQKLTDAELNINAGALHLSEMIVDNQFDIVKDIHKIIFSYNRGKNRMDNDGTKGIVGIDALINRYLGTEHNVGAAYIIRALGPDGAADILVNDLGIKA